MKFSTSKNELLKALTKLSKVSPLRSTLPILSCVLINATKEKTSIKSTDLELTTVVDLSVSIEEEGSAAIPLKQLYDITNELPETRISISVSNNSKIEIKTTSGFYDLMGKQKDEFPSTPKLKEESKIDFKGENLKKIINSTLFAVSKDDLKPALTGVLFRFNEKGLTVVSTDGHRLVKVYDEKHKSKNFKGDIVVPKKFLSYLLHHIKDENIILSIDENYLMAEINEDIIISRTISESFPDYESVIPADNNKTLIINKKNLLGAIKRVSIFSNKSTHQIAFIISKSGFFVATEDPEASSKAKEEIIAEYDGEDITIGYNGEYLKDVINHIENENVTINLNTPISATLFVFPDSEIEKTMLLMPVRLNS